MPSESDTEILNKHPLLKVCLDYSLKRLEAIIIAAIISAGIGGCNQSKESHDVKWIGQHLDEKEKQIEQIKKETE
jgi:hypothetical protein